MSDYQQGLLFEERAGGSYRVGDIVPYDNERLKSVFILESPYRDEVANRCPIAGASGKAIARFMHGADPAIPCDIPFGIYLKQKFDDRFAVLNCSNYPMDIQAYEELHPKETSDMTCQDGCKPHEDRRLSESAETAARPVHSRLDIPYDPVILDRIRKNIQSSIVKKKDSKYSEVLESLAEDFRKRLSAVLGSDCLFIVCGNIARNFLILAGVPSDDRFVFVPHPSRNQWSQQKYRDLMSDLKLRLCRMIAGGCR